MSYTIEYNKQMFYEVVNGEKIFYYFVRQGDNNVRDHSGNRPRDWYFNMAGTESEVWKVVAARAGAVDGGSLQRSVGWEETHYMTIEEYIKQYRSKIKNAKPLSTFFEKFRVSVSIYLKDVFPEGKQEIGKQLQNFVEKYEMRTTHPDYYDKELKGFTYNIKDVDTLRDFLLNLPSAYEDTHRVYYNVDKDKPRRRRW